MVLQQRGTHCFASTSEERESMSELEYHKKSDHTLETLFEAFEELLDGIDLEESDIELSQGVLTLKLGDLGTYVINKQTPNRQIWMSSPLSGPVRYDFEKGSWVYLRDGHHLHRRLQDELEKLTGRRLDLNPCSSCEKLNACLDNYDCVR
jgi:frataxin